MPGNYQTATIERIAAELSADTTRTPRAIETRLQFALSRATIRGVLALLVRGGRAIEEGDISQKRYRLTGLCSGDAEKRGMSPVITLMAKALQRELFDRGGRAFPLQDCEAIMAKVLEKSADAADIARKPAEDAKR